jgi:cephalosporin hydroxylase
MAGRGRIVRFVIDTTEKTLAVADGQHPAPYRRLTQSHCPITPLGRPIIRLRGGVGASVEVIVTSRPGVIIETDFAHGGSNPRSEPQDH